MTNQERPDRRQEARVPIMQTGMLSVLSVDGEPAMEPALPASVVNLSGHGMCVSLAVPVSLGAAVKVELEDTLLLGEVCYCIERDDGYLVGLELDQALTEVGSLLALVRGVMGAEDRSASRDLQAAYAMEYRDREHKQ